MIFEWNGEKARRNLVKHGVTFDEARSSFLDPLGIVYDDPTHSEAEKREILLGLSSRGRLLVVSFTQRGESIRIISARKATARECKSHED